MPFVFYRMGEKKCLTYPPGGCFHLPCHSFCPCQDPQFLLLVADCPVSSILNSLHCLLTHPQTCRHTFLHFFLFAIPASLKSHFDLIFLLKHKASNSHGNRVDRLHTSDSFQAEPLEKEHRWFIFWEKTEKGPLESSE